LPRRIYCLRTRVFAFVAFLSAFITAVYLFIDFSSGGRPMLYLFSKPVLLDGSKTLFFRFGDEIYYANQGNVIADYRVLPGADPKTFEVIDGIWAKDKSHVYLRYEQTDFSPKSFSVLNCYFSDGHSVYYDDFPKGTVTVSVDAENFRIIGEEQYSIPKSVCKAKDSENVYFWTRIIKYADPATFHFLNQVWAIDSTGVFMDGYLVKELSPEEMHAIGRRHVTDGITVFAPLYEPPYFTDLKTTPEAFRLQL
jgi:hypothetical protein